MEPFEIQRMIDDAVDQAILRYRFEIGEEKRYISENKAVKLRGTIVRRWIKEGLLKYVQDGERSMKRIDRYELEKLVKQANRISYLTVKERK
jgi:hypothetical protein